jgi:hypothetical protein
MSNSAYILSLCSNNSTQDRLIPTAFLFTTPLRMIIPSCLVYTKYSEYLEYANKPADLPRAGRVQRRGDGLEVGGELVELALGQAVVGRCGEVVGE